MESWHPGNDVFQDLQLLCIPSFPKFSALIPFYNFHSCLRWLTPLLTSVVALPP